MMRKYETIFIVNNTIGEEAVKLVVEKFKALLEANGQVESFDEWGKRKLAYLIDDIAEGYYVLCNFLSQPEFPLELERQYKIDDGIIKYIIIRKDN